MQFLPQSKKYSETEAEREGKFSKSAIEKTEVRIQQAFKRKTKFPRLSSVYYCVHSGKTSHDYYIQKDVISSDITIANIRDKIVFAMK